MRASTASSSSCRIRGVSPADARPQDLGVPLAIEGDQPVGPGDDLAGRAVVVLQADDLGVGPVALEVQNVRHFGAPPAIDRLVVVAHDAQVAMPGGQGLDDAILAAVGVLVLVDQEVIEALGLVRRGFWESGQKAPRSAAAGRRNRRCRPLSRLSDSGDRPRPPDAPCRSGQRRPLRRAGSNCSSSGRSDRADRPA